MKIEVKHIPSEYNVYVYTDEYCEKCQGHHEDIELEERSGDCIADYYSDKEDMIAEYQTDNFSGDY
jgi:hypothetical protein